VTNAPTGATMTTMPLLPRVAFFLFSASLSLIPSLALAAQEPTPTEPPEPEELPSVEDVARTAHELGEQLQQLQGPRADAKQLAQATKAMEDFVTKLETLEGLSPEHFVEAGSPLLATFPAYSLRITQAGLNHFADSRFLFDHAGIAKMQVALTLPLCAQRMQDLASAEQTFRKALSLTPDTFHAHLGLMQTLCLLDRSDEALEQCEWLSKDSEVAAAVPQLWMLEAGALLQANKPKDALAKLAEKEGEEAQILTLRAYALAGDASNAQKLIETMRKADPSARTLVQAIDALLYLGKKPEAAKLLALCPKAAEFSTEEERQDQLLSQCAAAMDVVSKATDWSPKSPLRAQLTKALDHHILVMDPAAKPKPKQVDLTVSPTLTAKMLANMPAGTESAKDWANRTLQVLCIRGIRAYTATPLEKQIAAAMKDQRLPTEADVPAIYAEMRMDLGDPFACGSLMALRAIEKLEAAMAAKK
jgi:tetratricopeptide (TPR) repeat protein